MTTVTTLREATGRYYVFNDKGRCRHCETVTFPAGEEVCTGRRARLSRSRVVCELSAHVSLIFDREDVIVVASQDPSPPGERELRHRTGCPKGQT